jgi:predicted DNA-binding WGR domain protein
MSARWSLLMKTEPGGGTRFFEVRRCELQVWSATGAVQTFGKDRTDQFESEEAAASAHRKMVDEQKVMGFQLVRDAPYDVTTFDYVAFIAEVRDGVREAFKALRAEHPAINGLALITDHDAMTIGLFANTKPKLDYNPWEWSNDYSGAALDIAYRMILSKVRDIPFEWVDGLSPVERQRRTFHGAKDGTLHRDGVYECFIRALEELRGEGLFGGPGDLLLLVSISDSEQIKGMAKRLNGRIGAVRFALAMFGSFFKLQPPQF